MLIMITIKVSLAEIVERPPATRIRIILIFAKKSYEDLIIEKTFKIFIRTKEDRKKEIATKNALRRNRSEKITCLKKERSFKELFYCI